MNRREFLAAAAALTAHTPGLLRPALGEAAALQLEAAAVRRAVAGGAPVPGLFGYNGTIPGPLLDLRQSEPVQLRVRNAMDRPTTVHWHGLRVPNGMDGVPGLTQAPIAPQGEFLYGFIPRDPGTYWYHPHFQSSEQLDRGLSGAIIVRGEGEPKVDRELVWLLDDWRVDEAGQPTSDFGNRHDLTHAGRLGNVVTINGGVPAPLRVRRNERIRLRLINAANARIFNLQFNGHRPLVIALDGHAVTPHVSDSTRVVLGPSMRADIILDCIEGSSGDRYPIRDEAYRRSAYTLTELVYEPGAAVRAPPLRESVALPPAALPMPDLAAAQRHQLALQGGAMGRMRSATLDGQALGIRDLVSRGKAWSLNGIVAHAHDMPPMFRFALGSSHVIEIRNETAWPHPVHLHGHPVLVLEGVPGSAPLPHWRDSVLVAPRAKALVALTADNPGRWMIHCHIPEHQEAGMMGVVQVA